jgi:hypothetical protein
MPMERIKDGLCYLIIEIFFNTIIIFKSTSKKSLYF